MKFFVSSLFLLSFCFAYTQTSEYKVLAEDQAIIWDMEWLGNDSIIYTELDGKVKLLDIENEIVIEVFEVSNLARENQAGLMGLQLAHDFKVSKKLFLAYTFYDADFNIYTRISSFLYNNQSATIDNENILVDSLISKNSNLGGRLLVDNSTIYFTSGDLQNENLAQDLNSSAGKILTFNLDGTPLGTGIYSYGHRNPQGICKTSKGNIIISEHGPFNDDEINILEQGRNYGWPLVGGMKVPANEAIYNQYNIKEPLAAYTPTIAPAGIDFYSSGPQAILENSLLVAALRDKAIHVLKLNVNQDSIVSQNRIDMNGVGRNRDVLVSPDGRVFASSSNKDIYGDPKQGDDKIIELFEPLFLGTERFSNQFLELIHIQNGLINNSSQVVETQVYNVSGSLIEITSLEPNQTLLLDEFKKGLYIVTSPNSLFLPQKVMLK